MEFVLNDLLIESFLQGNLLSHGLCLQLLCGAEQVYFQVLNYVKVFAFAFTFLDEVFDFHLFEFAYT